MDNFLFAYMTNALFPVSLHQETEGLEGAATYGTRSGCDVGLCQPGFTLLTSLVINKKGVLHGSIKAGFS